MEKMSIKKVLIALLLIFGVSFGAYWYFTQDSDEMPPPINFENTRGASVRQANMPVSYDQDDVDEFGTCSDDTIDFKPGSNIVYFTEDTTVDELLGEYIIPDDGLQLDVAFYSPGEPGLKAGYHSFNGAVVGVSTLETDWEIPKHRPIIVVTNRSGEFCNHDGKLKGSYSFLDDDKEIPSLDDIEAGWVLVASGQQLIPTIQANNAGDKVLRVFAISKDLKSYTELKNPTEFDTLYQNYSSIVWLGIGKEKEPDTDQPPVLAPVTNLKAEPSDEEYHVDLTWDPPANTDDIVGYEFTYGGSSLKIGTFPTAPAGSYGQTIDIPYHTEVVDNSEVTIGHITVNSVVGVQVDYGEYGKSEITYVTAPFADAIDLLAGLKVITSTPQTESTALVKWEKPAKTDQIKGFKFKVGGIPLTNSANNPLGVGMNLPYYGEVKDYSEVTIHDLTGSIDIDIAIDYGDLGISDYKTITVSPQAPVAPYVSIEPGQQFIYQSIAPGSEEVAIAEFKMSSNKAISIKEIPIFDSSLDQFTQIEIKDADGKQIHLQNNPSQLDDEEYTISFDEGELVLNGNNTFTIYVDVKDANTKPTAGLAIDVENITFYEEGVEYDIPSFDSEVGGGFLIVEADANIGFKIVNIPSSYSVQPGEFVIYSQFEVSSDKDISIESIKVTAYADAGEGYQEYEIKNVSTGLVLDSVISFGNDEQEFTFSSPIEIKAGKSVTLAIQGVIPGMTSNGQELGFGIANFGDIQFSEAATFEGSFPLKFTNYTVGSATACVPQCDGKTCGSDGCGGTCGACGPGLFCSGALKCEISP